MMAKKPREYIDDKDFPLQRNRVKGKRLIILSIFIILILFLSSQLLYFYVIPRTTLDLRTNYHEALGGGGTGGLINVNSKFINSGTVDIENFNITVTVLNNTKILLVEETYDQALVKPGDNYELKLATNGNCFETFYIIVELNFETQKNEYSRKYLYETYEEAMNIGFEDSIFNWGN